MHKPRIRASLILTAGMILAACGSTAPAAPSTAGPSSAASSPSPAASPASAAPRASSAGSAAPSSAAASGTNGSAAAAGPIKVGVLESLTGSFAGLSKDNQDGFNLYLDSIGGTVAGRKIQVIYADDAGKPDVALTKAQQFVQSDKVDLIMGAHISPICNALTSFAKNNPVPIAITGNCPNETLMSDPKLKSPNLMRFTWVGSQLADPAADWAYKNGHRKAIMIAGDFIGGLELVDSFGSAFVQRGGSVVQELYAPLGTTDFGPYLAQLDPQADLLFSVLAGNDALKFADGFRNYVGQRKLQILSVGGGINDALNVAQLKDKAVGVVGSDTYCECVDTPENQAFLKQFHQKYPGRVVSRDAAQGYVGAEILESAIKKVQGNAEDKQKLLEALGQTSLVTAEGPIKLDADHDVVKNVYIYQIIQQGSGTGYKVLQTYDAVGRTWDRTPAELASFPFGKLKGKWVGMTQGKLQATSNAPTSS